MKPKALPVLNEDGTLSLPAQKLTAQQLDELLMVLAQSRSQMAPPVSNYFATGTRATHQPEPAAFVRRQPGREISLALRHVGFGWLVFTFEPETAARLADGLAVAVVEPPPQQGPSRDLN